MDQSEDGLNQKILKWLETQGYPLELEVAQAFQKEGFNVSVSDWYKDFDSDEAREIDVTAAKLSDVNTQKFLQVCFRIECKTAQDKPWVVFRSKSQRDKYIPFDFLVTDEYRHFLFNVMTKDDVGRDKLKRLPLFMSFTSGHGVTQAFTTGQDIPYKAVMSTLKASVDRIIGLQEMQKDKVLSETDMNQFWGIVFPVIMIDGLLFECNIEDEGNIKIDEVEISAIDWKGRIPVPSSPAIYIVTKRALNKYISFAKDTADGLIAMCPSQ